MPGGLTVEFTDYAELRMHQRDILREEVLAALESPRSRHKSRADGRWEVTQSIRRKALRVIYRRESALIIVINAMWD